MSPPLPLHRWATAASASDREAVPDDGSTVTKETGNMKRLPFWLWTIGSLIFVWVLIDAGAGLGVVWAALVYTAQYAFLIRLCAMRARDMGADEERIARCVFVALAIPFGYLALGFAQSASGNSLWSNNPPGAFRRWLAGLSDFRFAAFAALWYPVILIFVGYVRDFPSAIMLAVFVAVCAIVGLTEMLVIKAALRPGERTNLYRFSNASAPRPRKLIKTIGWTSAGVVSLIVVAIIAYVVVHSLVALGPVRAASMHDQLVQYANSVSASLPQKIDEETTQTAVHVDGLRATNVYELNRQVIDANLYQTTLTQRVCGGEPTHGMVVKGATYRYEYWNAGKFLGGFDVTSCPSVIAAETKADANTVPVVVDHGRVLAPLSVGSNSIYAMIDTGCNYMTVTESVAKELLANHEAAETEGGDAILSDGSSKHERRIIIRTVTIGGHAIHDVVAGVNPDGAIMLLGYPVLNRVSDKFSINTTKSTLEFN